MLAKQLGKRICTRTIQWGLVLTIFLWTALIPQQLVAQQPANPLTDRLSELASPILDTFNVRIETRWVMLDGRRIFLVAAPSLSAEAQQEREISPVEERVREIERQLKAIARDVLEGRSPLEVTTSPFGVDSGLYTIEVGERYLMTVTPWDAKALGARNLKFAAFTTAGKVRIALERALEERSTAYVRQASFKTVGIAVGGGATELAILAHEEACKSVLYPANARICRGRTVANSSPDYGRIVAAGDR